MLLAGAIKGGRNILLTFLVSVQSSYCKYMLMTWSLAQSFTFHFSLM